MSSLEIRHVHKTFGPTEIIKDVSLSVPDGAFVVLVGPSGCGKSTLLRMIAGLEDISSGTISIGGKVINEVEPKHRDIAMVFQNYALYPHMTIAENMGFSLRLAGRAKEEIARKVQEAASILGLSEYLNRYPKQLSGGQRQRVAMGRAIVRDPQVFLFDEPLSNLDAKLRVQMRGELKELHERLRTTMVYVTHDQIEAMTMADVIVVMRAGVVEQVGAPLELYDRPRNLFVAGFIGSPAMNQISGHVEHRGEEAFFVTGGGYALPLPDNGVPDGKMILGLRPESLSPASQDMGLPAVVRQVEHTGAEAHVTLEVEGQKMVMLLRERLSVTPGQAVRLVADPAAFHFFDADTGARIS
jgi:multiple sugar transport system ATP-binding protein